MPLSKYVRKVVYLPYNQFWRSRILPIVHVSIFLILLALKTLAMYSQKTKFSQRPLPIQESSALVLVRLLVDTTAAPALYIVGQ